MQSSRLELALNTINTKYSDSISLIALGKARRVGFRSSADMFTKAFVSYDENIPSEVIGLISARKTCSHFIERFKIKFKQDIYYVIRHPEQYKNCKIEDSSDTRRRIILFSNLDSSEEEKKACSFLEAMKPRERASIAAKIIDQHLILTGNEYYFDQTSARLYHYLCENAKFDENGNVQPKLDALIGLIWKYAQ